MRRNTYWSSEIW